MRVEMVHFGGIWNGRYLRKGEIVDVPQELAEAMLKDGRAIEVTTKGPRENTAKRTGKVTR